MDNLSILVSNVRQVKHGKLTAKFHLSLGSKLIRDCILWGDHLSRPLRVSGPCHRQHACGAWVEDVAIEQNLKPRIMELVIAELAIQNKPKATPAWVAGFQDHDREMMNSTPVHTLTGPSHSTTRRKTFAQLRASAY